MHVVRSGSGPSLVLVHGIGSSHTSMEPVVAALSADFTVHNVDLPGFGASPMLERPPTMRALADAVAGVVDGPFAVAGNSLGGGVALHLALDGRARAACALSPVGFVEGMERAWLQGFVRSMQVLAPPEHLTGSLRVRRIGTWVVMAHAERLSADQFRKGIADSARPGRIPTAAHALNWRAPAVDALPCPVTIAWGDRDRLLPYARQFPRVCERMPGARHVTLQDIGHAPTFDDPALTARVIRDAVAG